MKRMKQHTKDLDTAKAVLRGELIVLNAYNNKTERSQVNKLMSHIKELENKKKQNSKLADKNK